MNSSKNGIEQKEIILILKRLQANAESLLKSSKSVLESYHQIIVAIDNGHDDDVMPISEPRPLRREGALAIFSKQVTNHQRVAADYTGKIRRQAGDLAKALEELKHSEGKHATMQNIFRSFMTSLKTVNVNLGLAEALFDVFPSPTDRRNNYDRDKASILISTTAELAERDWRGWSL